MNSKPIFISTPNLLHITHKHPGRERPDMTLDDAQFAKMELIARKLDLRPGMQLLEIGFGHLVGASPAVENLFHGRVVLCAAMWS